MAEFPEHAFWDFSLAVYGRPGVSEACMQLQERLVIDVNLLLFCLWAAADGRTAFSHEEMRTIMASAEEWHEGVVKPLRRARRRMKNGADGVALDLVLSVRKQLAMIEIETEHLEQLIIAAAAGIGSPATANDRPKDVAQSNLTTYFQAIGARPDAEDDAAIGHILRAAFQSESD